LQSTNSLSGLRITRLLDSLTNTYTVESGREGIQYKAETARTQVPELLAVLGDQMRPRLTEWEVRDQREAVASDRELLLGQSCFAISEAVHLAAFRGAGLGRPSVAPSFQIDQLTHEALQQYVASEFVGSRIVVAGVGIDHDTLASHVERGFGYLPAGNAAQASAQQYTGGESLTVGGNGTRVAIAFNGVAFGSEDFVAARALNIVLGGGVQYKGTPGDGLTSRLYTALEKNALLRSAASWSLSYSDAGLFGVQGYTTSGGAPAVVELLAKELGGLKKVTDEEAARASALARSNVLNAADTRLGALEFIAKQALSGSDKIQSPAEFTASTQFAVTSTDLNKVAKKILSSNPTLVATGDIAGVPTLEQVRKLVSS
jgi:mitochondrial-processing peptidase subunit alpha